jgi:hypothetical protein
LRGIADFVRSRPCAERTIAPLPQYRTSVRRHFSRRPHGEGRDLRYEGGDGPPGAAVFLEQGNARYSVILVKLPEAAPVDKSFVDHAAEQIARKGTVRFRFSNCYDPGVPGAQLNLAESNGNQLRASVYMWDRQLYITEVSAPEGSGAALQFEQSITILDPMGEDLNTGQGSPPC